MLRLAIISTPRSGNTWLRRLLATAYGLEELGLLSLEEAAWGRLPRRIALQIHWHPTETLASLLAREGVHVVVLARHPLDVLISALNFVYYSHDPALCPKRPGCEDCKIVGESPRSPVFLQYACGKGASDLLSYTPAWWPRPGIHRVRYEDLVADPARELARLEREFQRPVQVPIAQAVAANTMSKLRSHFARNAYHFWQGRPGLWKSLITAPEARRMAAAHRGVFETLGYACDPDESLTETQASANWQQLQAGRPRYEATRRSL